MPGSEKIRIDKWLWAVRVFKTRSLANECCASGKVKIEGKSVKPSRLLRVGEKVHVKKGDLLIIYEVVKLIPKRVSAKLAADCYIDHSPPPPIKPNKKLPSAFFDIPVAYRAKGEGRPTKKQRREIDRLKDWDELKDE